MEIKSKILNIKCSADIDEIENYFKKNKIKPVRWAIIDEKNDILTLDLTVI